MSKNIDFNLLLRVVRFSFDYKRMFYAALIMALMLAPLGALRPYLINLGVDKYILNSDMSALLTLCWVIVSLVIVEAGLRFSLIISLNLSEFMLPETCVSKYSIKL